MTPTKQTVYLPVNGNQEKYVISDNDAGYFNGVIEKEGYFFTPEQLNEYTQGVIKQALETGAEKAEPNILNKCAKNPKFTIVDVDKKSITNTFEETYEKLKV